MVFLQSHTGEARICFLVLISLQTSESSYKLDEVASEQYTPYRITEEIEISKAFSYASKITVSFVKSNQHLFVKTPL